MTNDIKSRFFRDLAAALAEWRKSAAQALLSDEPDLHWIDKPESFERLRAVLRAANVDSTDVDQIFEEVLRGVLVTALTILDGGSAMSEKGRLYLVDQKGGHVGNGLHDDFVSYLLDTGQLS